MEATQSSNVDNPPSDEDVAELLILARQKDGVAITALLERYTPELYGVIRNHMPSQIRVLYDSTDFFQEIAIALLTLQVFPAFSSPTAFRAFVRKMAKNSVLTAVRKTLCTQRRNMRQVVSLSTICEEELAQDEEVSKLDQIIAKEAWNLALNREPPLFRFIMARRREGQTYAEIAAVIGMCEGSVRFVLKKICKKNNWNVW